MGLVRMFHYDCDARAAGYECEGETGDEWYQTQATIEAKRQGWHIRHGVAICPTCWEVGARYAEFEAQS
jgi:hypothetical protein